MFYYIKRQQRNLVITYSISTNTMYTCISITIYYSQGSNGPFTQLSFRQYSMPPKKAAAKGGKKGKGGKKSGSSKGPTIIGTEFFPCPCNVNISLMAESG